MIKPSMLRINMNALRDHGQQVNRKVVLAFARRKMHIIQKVTRKFFEKIILPKVNIASYNLVTARTLIA
jgi:hypothetical protein